jgi:chaperonin cofactor prefoldin
MFAERPFEEFLDNLIIQTLNPIGIEIVGAVLVAISFLLVRDANREKIDSLERKIETLQAGQADIMETMRKIETKMNYKTKTGRKKTESSK